MANLKIKNLQKGFEGFSIIKGIDLEVNDKEFVVFVGPSGCGKSTLLRLIAGLEEVSEGTIELDGREHRDDPAVQRRDRKKGQICREHGFELIRVENSYARRYNYIKSILINYFRKVS